MYYICDINFQAPGTRHPWHLGVNTNACNPNILIFCTPLQDITGAKLAELGTNDALKTLGVTSVGHRLLLVKAIAGMQSHSSAWAIAHGMPLCSVLGQPKRPSTFADICNPFFFLFLSYLHHEHPSTCLLRERERERACSDFLFPDLLFFFIFGCIHPLHDCICYETSCRPYECIVVCMHKPKITFITGPQYSCYAKPPLRPYPQASPLTYPSIPPHIIFAIISNFIFSFSFKVMLIQRKYEEENI